MTHRWIAAVGLCVVAVASTCGGPEKRSEPARPAGPPPAPPAPALFEELRFYEGNAHLYTLRNDGVVVAIEKRARVATLTPDMTLQVAGGSNATLSDGGAITVDGKPSDYRINADNTLVVPGGGVVSLQADGTVGGLATGNAPLRIEGATKSESLRAAMFLLALVTMPTTSASRPQCGDGSIVSCDMKMAACPKGLVRAVVGGCYDECVDPMTCEAPEAPKEPPRRSKPRRRGRRR